MEFPWLFLFENKRNKKWKRKKINQKKEVNEKKEKETNFEESDQPWWECKIFVIFDSISFYF